MRRCRKDVGKERHLERQVAEDEDHAHHYHGSGNGGGEDEEAAVVEGSPDLFYQFQSLWSSYLCGDKVSSKSSCLPSWAFSRNQEMK